MRPFFRKRSNDRNHLSVHKTFVPLSTSVELCDPFSKHVSKPLFKNSDLTGTRPLCVFTRGLIILISTCFGLYIKHAELWISTSALKESCVGTRGEVDHSQNCLPGKVQGYYQTVWILIQIILTHRVLLLFGQKCSRFSM